MRFQLETLRRGLVQCVSVSVWPVKGEAIMFVFLQRRSALPTARNILVCTDNCVKI